MSEAALTPDSAAAARGDRLLSVRIGWRNLWRNRRRTWLTAGGISFAVLLVVSVGLLMVTDGEPNQDGAEDVVAIDGPSGSGKSTVAQALATRLGYQYLDTGAMYRAVTWHFLRHQVTLDLDLEHLDSFLDTIKLGLPGFGRVLLDGVDVTEHLRSQEVESRVSAVAALPGVRRRMRFLQRSIAQAGPVVAEGRDMASVVFPEARWKFYIDADPKERARRRCADFRARGRDVSVEEVLEEILVRDGLDSNREDAPLIRTEGATYVDTTGMSLEQVVDHLAAAVAGATRTGQG